MGDALSEILAADAEYKAKLRATFVVEAEKPKLIEQLEVVEEQLVKEGQDNSQSMKNVQAALVQLGRPEKKAAQKGKKQ